MPRPRLSQNKGLPKRWQFTHGAYYFRVPSGMEGMWDGKKRFRLGATLAEAYRTFATRTEINDTPRKTIGALLDQYQLEVLPQKAPKTRYDQVAQIARLRSVFGDMPIEALLPQHVYKYARKRAAQTAAKREIEILSHAFTKAVEWGDIARHPFMGEVRLEGSSPRDRYVDDWEIVECLQLPSKRKKGSVLAVQAYIRLKLLTGMSRGDLLRLKPATQFKDDGIHVQRNKTKKSSGKRTIYEWTEELRKAVQIAAEARPAANAEYLFCNRHGEGYVDADTGTAKGWDSLWQGFVDRVLKETKVTQRFTEHDLRAKVASDAESLDRARALLAHVDARLTERFYRRKPERVRPMK
jgi:integrase